MEVTLLPFLKKKNEASISGLIIKHRTPDEAPETQDEQADQSAAIEECASELIDAVHARDIKRVAAAFKDAFDILEAMPHDEVDHTESEDV